MLLLSALLTLQVAQCALSAAKRQAKLDELTEGGSKVADITATQFQQLVQSSINERTDYSIVIEYTALPERFGCKVCADFHADIGYSAKASKGRSWLVAFEVGPDDWSTNPEVFSRKY